MTRSQRIEEAFKLFARGYSNADVARVIGIHADTATSYRRMYEDNLSKQASSNPHIFGEVLANTQRMLVELDQVRTNAWEQIHTTRQVPMTCDHCGEDSMIDLPISDQARVQYQNVILKAQHERAQLHQLLSNRTEVLVRFEHTRIVQERILGWMRDNLPVALREQLATFIETELSEYMGELPSGGANAQDPDAILDGELVD